MDSIVQDTPAAPVQEVLTVEAKKDALAPLGNTQFDFCAKVFQVPGARFVLAAAGAWRPRQAMFAIALDKAEGMITLQSLRREFNIKPGSSDDQLLVCAENGLRFVPDIRPGDAIPSEILNGTASWKMLPRHKKIARERIQAQLISWVTGQPLDASDANAVRQVMKSPDCKKMLRETFSKVAIKLELSKPEDVVDRIETLSRELCYIEALRDRCNEVQKIYLKLNAAIKSYRGDRQISEWTGRCKMLMVEGRRELFTPLALVDVKFSDIVEALKNIDQIITDVRETRDNLHNILMEWDPVVACWKELQPKRSGVVVKAIEALYRLLAMKFASGKSLLTGKRVRGLFGGNG